MSTPTHHPQSPLSTLQTAERAVVGQINSVADAVSTIGTSALDAAMNRLKSEVTEAQERLQSAMRQAACTVLDLAQELLSLTCLDQCGVENFMLEGPESATLPPTYEPSSPTIVVLPNESVSVVACEPIVDEPAAETTSTEIEPAAGKATRKRATRRKTE